MNGYRPIVELMNANFGIYGMAELSSAGNTFATTGGQFNMPMTVIGAGGTAPNQSLGAEHSQPFHAYIMGIPGLKICTASKPHEAYGLAKSMIRDNGPGVLLLPVKLMKTRGPCEVDNFLPLHKATLQHEASAASIAAGKAVTVLTYLHGTKESEDAERRRRRDFQRAGERGALRRARRAGQEVMHGGRAGAVRDGDGAGDGEARRGFGRGRQVHVLRVEEGRGGGMNALNYCAY